MRKILLILLLLSSFYVFSSGTNNPKDEIYEHIDIWRNQGLIDRLPPVRPYSAQYIISLLEKVINNGNENDIKVAKKYLEYYTSYSLDFSLKHNSYTDLDDHNTISGLGAEANLPLNDYVYGNLDINSYLLSNKNEVSAMPVTRSTGIDYNVDNMSLEAAGKKVYMYQGLNLNASFGTKDVWFQSGFMPTSFGPLFSDSVVVNPYAVQAPHYSVTWIHKHFTYSNLFMPLNATDNTGFIDSITDDKYIHVRSLDFKLTSFWEFQFYETVVYGGKGIKPVFFLPFSQFFYSAGKAGTWDVSSLMGIGSRFDFGNNISLKINGYLDDINAKEFAKLNLDTKLKMAGQAEIEWTPKKSVFNFVKASYTAITPFMYTHITETPENSTTFTGEDKWDIRHHALSQYTNYENYTHNGKSLGPYGMEPNSDKVAVNVGFKLPKGFKLKVNGQMQRHGNANTYKFTDEVVGNDLDNVTDKDGNASTPITPDGSIFDPGYGWEEGYMYQDSNKFLSQDVIETIVLAELIITTPEIPVFTGVLSGELGYTYMYIDNYKLDKGKTVTDNFLRLSVSYKL